MSERESTTFTLRYAVERRIAATPAAVWARLGDAAAMRTWNSTIESLEGEFAVGNRLALRVPLAPGRTFKPKVVELVPERRMVWRDGFFPMFQGTRTFTLTPEEGGAGTLFAMVEVFRGLMLPMIKGSLPDFGGAFDRFADDLRAACEG
jgi:uncharacterized protein YndB with AHSA1/START domain